MPFLNLQRHSIRWLLAELIVVVLGIVVAFQFEEWRTNREHREAEKAILRGVTIDLESELENLANAKSSYQRQLDGSLRLIANMASIDTVSAEELAQNYLDTIIGIFWFSTAPTYMGIRDSGDLSLISDPGLLREFNYYFENRIPYVERFSEFTTARRDVLLLAAGDYMFYSRTDLFSEVDNHTVVEVNRPGGAKSFVVFNAALNEISQDKRISPALGGLNARLADIINLTSQAEMLTQNLISTIDDHLETL